MYLISADYQILLIFFDIEEHIFGIKSGYKVNYYNYRNQYMVCNVRRICNVYIVNIKVRIKTYPHVCPKFVIMCKYENCVCKYLTFLFRCEILFENNLIILLYDNVQQYN